jgi:hypothetical protein
MSPEEPLRAMPKLLADVVMEVTGKGGLAVDV